MTPGDKVSPVWIAMAIITVDFCLVKIVQPEFERTDQHTKIYNTCSVFNTERTSPNALTQLFN